MTCSHCVAQTSNFLNECHSFSLGLGFMKGYIVHFPIPLLSLYQICKVCRNKRQVIADRVDLIIVINQNPLHVIYL